MRLLLIFVLFLTTHVFIFSAKDWPAGSGTIYSLSDLQKKLNRTVEPSGSAWHSGRSRLYIASDEGDLIEMNKTGMITNYWELRKELINLADSSDLEGVAITHRNTPYVYLGIEGANTIVEFNLKTGSLSQKKWDLRAWMGLSIRNGLEALTFVPNGEHPYPKSTSGGVFYVGLQADENSEAVLYVFDINLSTSGEVNLLHEYKPRPGTDDLAALDYQFKTKKIYAIFDNKNILAIMTTSGTIIEEYLLPGYEEEAFSLIPNCFISKATVFIGDDAKPRVLKYTNFPITCKKKNRTP